MNFTLGQNAGDVNNSDAVAGNSSSAVEADQESLPFPSEFSVLTWIDYCGFVLHSLIFLLGTTLNGFLVWVFGAIDCRTNTDVIYLNLASHDAINGVIQFALFSASRVIFMTSPYLGFQVSIAAGMLVMVATNFQTLTTVIITTLQRNKVPLILQ